MKFAPLNNVNRNTENPSLEEQILVTIQLFVAIAFLISWLVNALLTYDLYLKKHNKKPLFSNQNATNLSAYNQIYTLVLIIIIAFINYQYIDVSKKKEDGDVASATGQFFVSILSLIAGSISLFIILNDFGKQFSETNIENFEV